MYYLDKTLGLTFLAALLLLFTGCDISDPGSSSDHKVSVKMKVQSSTTSQKISQTPSTQAIDSLTEIKLLVEELELESTFDDDSLDFEVDDLIVNLPLDGTEFTLTSATVPDGVYDEFEMEMEGPDEDSNIQDPDFYNGSGDDDDDGYSIVIKGVYNGEDFTYRSEEDFELELGFNPPLEISNNTSPSIAINVDPSSWFKDSSGNDLDPNDPNNREKIDENIENSFEVEEDDDDDSEDDDDDSDD
jgi:hypothetical protein